MPLLLLHHYYYTTPPSHEGSFCSGPVGLCLFFLLVFFSLLFFLFLFFCWGGGGRGGGVGVVHIDADRRCVLLGVGRTRCLIGQVFDREGDKGEGCMPIGGDGDR